MNRADHRQLSLEALLEPPPAIGSGPGSLDIGLKIREALSALLHEAADPATGRKIDRHDVASAMSRLSGRDHTKNMLDRYAAPSAEDWRFPLEALPALVKATGDYRLLFLVAEACGASVNVGDEVLDARIARVQREVEERETLIKNLKRLRSRR